MSTWQSGYVAANGIRIHYTRTGGDKPPVVLVHGVTDDGLCWTPVAEGLAAAYDVIMADARGHGRSEAPETGYDPATQAADLAGLIAGLGLRKPAVLGHSMGAVTTLALAGSYPDVPRAVVLEDPPERLLVGQALEPAQAAEERLAGVRAWFTGLKGKTREELIAQQRAATPHWSEAELGLWADSKMRLSPQVWNVFAGAPGAAVDWGQILQAIRCPALFITADVERGALLGQDGVAALQERLPQARVAHIAGAGHSVHRDQLDGFLAVVLEFLREAA
jgi:pimeloyl-ACP methyl ester carboxylesterase